MTVVIATAYRQHTAFIRQLPQLVDSGQGETVYHGRNQVVRFRHDGLTLMVKRYKTPNIIQRLVYTFFRKTKAERAFLFASTFLSRGIDTPTPVAYMEQRRFGLFATGYFVSLEAPGTETHLLLREVKDYPKELAEAVARQVLSMHSKGILHGDLNLSNFLCTQDDEGYHFTMIDINRSHFRDGMPSDDECMKNMVRLTHRRDLYEDLIRRYAALRGWDADAASSKALEMLRRFEHRK